MKRNASYRNIFLIGAVCFLFPLITPHLLHAQSASSENYSLEAGTFYGGGSSESSSESYQSSSGFGQPFSQQDISLEEEEPATPSEESSRPPGQKIEDDEAELEGGSEPVDPSLIENVITAIQEFFGLTPETYIANESGQPTQESEYEEGAGKDNPRESEGVDEYGGEVFISETLSQAFTFLVILILFICLFLYLIRKRKR